MITTVMGKKCSSQSNARSLIAFILRRSNLLRACARSATSPLVMKREFQYADILIDQSTQNNFVTPATPDQLRKNGRPYLQSKKTFSS